MKKLSILGLVLFIISMVVGVAFALPVEEESPFRYDPAYSELESEFEPLSPDEVLAWDFINGAVVIFAVSQAGSCRKIGEFPDAVYWYPRFSRDRRLADVYYNIGGYYDPTIIIDGDAGTIKYLGDVHGISYSSSDFRYYLYLDIETSKRVDDDYLISLERSDVGAVEQDIYSFGLYDIENKKVVYRFEWTVGALIGAGVQIYRSDQVYGYRLLYIDENGMRAEGYFDIEKLEFVETANNSAGTWEDGEAYKVSEQEAGFIPEQDFLSCSE